MDIKNLFEIQKEFLVYLHAYCPDPDVVRSLIEYEKKKREIESKGYIDYYVDIQLEYSRNSYLDYDDVSRKIIEEKKKQELSKLKKEYGRDKENKKSIIEKKVKERKDGMEQYQKMLDNMSIEEKNFHLLDRRPDAKV